MDIRFSPFCPTQDQRNFNALQSTRGKCRHALREEREMTHSSSFLKPISASRKRLHSYTPHISQCQTPRNPSWLDGSKRFPAKESECCQPRGGTPEQKRAPSNTSILVTDTVPSCSSRRTFSPTRVQHSHCLSFPYTLLFEWLP